MPIALVSWVSSLSDRYLIGGTHGLDEAGVYVAAYALASRPFVMLTTTLLTLMRPKYYDAISSGHRAEAAHTLRNWLRLSFGLGLSAALLVALARHLIVAVTLDARYRAAADLLLPITLGYAFSTCAQVYATVCLALKRPSYATLIELTGAVAALVTEIPMIRWRGAVGAAWAVPMYYGVQMLVARQVARALLGRFEARAQPVAGSEVIHCESALKTAPTGRGTAP
jgi:O-antigen/teichoic acid export membrane protein